MKKTFHLLVMVLGLTSASGHPGIGIVQNSKGEVFYTDLKQVWKITLSGRVELAVPDVHTHELYLDPQGNLYGEHLWYNGEQKNTWGHYVWKRAADGTVTKVVPDTEGFLEDYSFVRDHFGRMYWADRTASCQKVVRRNANNSRTTLDAPCFHNIRALHALHDGSVVVVDFQDIRKITAQGKVVTVATRIANKKWTTSNVDNQNAVMGIWDDAEGNLYAAVMSERMVKRFRPDGTEGVVFKTSFPWTPTGGMVDSMGRLWVLETNTVNDVRVERRDATGQQKIFLP